MTSKNTTDLPVVEKATRRSRNMGTLVILRDHGDGKYERVAADKVFANTGEALAAAENMHVPASELEDDISEISTIYYVARLVRGVKLETKATIEQVATSIEI